MRIQRSLSSPELWRMGESTRRTLHLYLSGTQEISMMQRIRGASWDVFHDPALGTFDKLRIVRDALTNSPDPLLMVRKMTF